MKNILITGGAGFIGSHVTVELIESGIPNIQLGQADLRRKS